MPCSALKVRASRAVAVVTSSVLMLVAFASPSVAKPPPPPTPVPVPAPSGTPPPPVLTPQQQAQLRSLVKAAQNDRKALSCAIYFGPSVYQVLFWGTAEIGLAYGTKGLATLPPPSGITPAYKGQCHEIDWKQLSVFKIIAWPMSDPLLGVPDPSHI
jgi:hypothetical protein